MSFIAQIMGWCPDAESNHGHRDFQSLALPTELSGHSITSPLYSGQIINVKKGVIYYKTRTDMELEVPIPSLKYFPSPLVTTILSPFTSLQSSLTRSRMSGRISW